MSHVSSFFSIVESKLALWNLSCLQILIQLMLQGQEIFVSAKCLVQIVRAVVSMRRILIVSQCVKPCLMRSTGWVLYFNYLGHVLDIQILFVYLSSTIWGRHLEKRKLHWFTCTLVHWFTLDSSVVEGRKSLGRSIGWSVSILLEYRFGSSAYFFFLWDNKNLKALDL